MRTLGVAVLMAFASLTPAGVSGQESTRPGPEIGVQSALGFVRGEGEDEWVSVISLPGNTLYGMGALYATLFASQTVAVEPQVSFVRLGSGGESAGLVQLNVQLMQFFGDPNRPAAYGGAQVGVVSGFGTGGGDTGFVAGGLVGYRTIVRGSLGVRLEGRYRRWFGDAFARNELGLILGLGAVLRSRV